MHFRNTATKLICTTNEVEPLNDNVCLIMLFSNTTKTSISMNGRRIFNLNICIEQDHPKVCRQTCNVQYLRDEKPLSLCCRFDNVCWDYQLLQVHVQLLHPEFVFFGSNFGYNQSFFYVQKNVGIRRLAFVSRFLQGMIYQLYLVSKVASELSGAA